MLNQEVFVNKGLNTDIHENLLPTNSLVYLLNGDITGYENGGNGTFVQNTLSNELCFSFPEGYELLGNVPLDKGQFTLFFKTPNSSEIGLFDSNTCAYVPKINNPCLNFTKKIKGRFKNLPECDSRRVYYVDGTTQLRFIDIDECLPVKNVNDCDNCEKDLQFDCEAFNVNRCVKFPKITMTEGVGNLPNGSYQVAIALTDDKQRYTEYYIYPEVIRFHTNNQGNNRFSINIDFEDCPLGYDEYELVLITNRVDRATQAQRVGYFPETQTSVVISELDETSYTPIDTSVLLQQYPRYQTVDHIVANNETLVLGGVTYREQPNYQFLANQIKSNWVVKRVKASEAKNHMSFMRGENYAFFLRGVYCDGERTNWFHLPSDAERKIKERDLSAYNNLFTEVTGPDAPEATDECNPNPPLYWQVYDTSYKYPSSTDPVDPSDPNCKFYKFTCYGPLSDGDFGEPMTVTHTNCCGDEETSYFSVNVFYLCVADPNSVVISGLSSTGNPYYVQSYEEIPSDCETDCSVEVDPCAGDIVCRGDFGYWESELRYPNNPCIWGQRREGEDFYHPYGLACQKIRYHKFPDNCTTHIHEQGDCQGEEYVNILGVEFSNIPPFIDKDGNVIKDIVGYEIGVADRTNHKSILHKGLIYNMWEEQLPDCTTSYYANYPFNDLNDDVFLSQTKALYDGLGQFGEENYTPVNTYSRDKFQYISPDVSFERNDSGQYLQIYTEQNGFVEGYYDYTFDMPKFVYLSDLAYITTLGVGVAAALGANPIYNTVLAVNTALNSLMNGLPPVSYGVGYYAKTAYNRFNCTNVQPGNIRRKIDFSQYLLPSKILAGDYKVNNYQRESGLFLDLSSDITDPSVNELSRVRLSDNNCQGSFGFCQSVNTGVPVTSSYYAGVKVEKPNQYGFPDSNLVRTISNVIEWDNQTITSTGPLFGGDVYITKHKYIRKFPFFTALPLGAPDNTKFETSPYFNVWNPRYWVDNNQDNSLFSAFGGVFTNDERNFDEARSIRRTSCNDESSGDCSGNLFFRVDGKFYTHVIGEAEYWCESEYIGDFRELNEIPESDIERDVNQKLAYRTVRLPELFLYNRQYHWKGLSNYTDHADMDYDCCRPEKPCYSNLVAYSLKNDPFSKGDSWLKFLPDNIQQFSQQDGKLIGIKEIDDYNLMILFENGTYVTQQDDSLRTENGRVYIGTPALFERRLRKISDDATGFGGCIDIDSIINTRFGTFYFDRPRRKFIHFSQGVTDATRNMNSWFQEHLADTVDIKGVFDNFTGNLYYTGISETGCSWTLSYKPMLEDWVSYHSFIPESYIQMQNNYLTVKDGGIWKHNKKYNYQTYYGKKYKFDVGFVISDKFRQMILKDFEIYSEWVKYLDYNCKIYDNKKFFNKILVYNQMKSTGVVDIVLKDLNNENHFTFQNRTDLVECTNLEDFIYRLNKFTVYKLNQPLICETCMDYETPRDTIIPSSNTMDQADMRGRWFRVHLINDKETEYKILLQLNIYQNETIIQ